MSQISAPDYFPQLVLYSDGTLVRWDELKRQFESCLLAKSEATRLVNLSELRKLWRSYEGSTVIEDRGWLMVFRDRGLMRATAGHEAAPNAARFNRARERLLAFHCVNPVTWYPARTELVLFPTMSGTESPLMEYPPDWPTPTPVVSRYANDFKRPVLHTYLDGKRFYEMRSRLEEMNDPAEKLVHVRGELYVIRLRAPMQFESLWYGVAPEPD
jgi:hypothetical protein